MVGDIDLQPDISDMFLLAIEILKEKHEVAGKSGQISYIFCCGRMFLSNGDVLEWNPTKYHS